jgi:hypothetical protein
VTSQQELTAEQRELEVLRRLADCVRNTYRDAAGVFSLRTHRVEKWTETDLPGILRTLDAVQGAQAGYGRNWEVNPSDDAGVFLLNGRRVKIVPVEPTDRMVNDDNASDPPMSHPFGAVDADSLRYIYKQLIRVAPEFPTGKALLDALQKQAGETSPATGPLEQPAPTTAGATTEVAQDGQAKAPQLAKPHNPRSDSVSRLSRAIEEAEHKPGTWRTANSALGAIAAVNPEASAPLAPQEKILGHFSYKRDSWLATAAVNALPQLLAIAQAARAVLAAPHDATSYNDWADIAAKRTALLKKALDDFESA